MCSVDSCCENNCWSTADQVSLASKTAARTRCLHCAWHGNFSFSLSQPYWIRGLVACLSLVWSSCPSPSPVYDMMLLSQLVFGPPRLLVPGIVSRIIPFCGPWTPAALHGWCLRRQRPTDRLHYIASGLIAVRRDVQLVASYARRMATVSHSSPEDDINVVYMLRPTSSSSVGRQHLLIDRCDQLNQSHYIIG